LSLAAARRLITLTGAGGIGKTRLALAAARQLLPHFADGVWLAEFSPLSDPGLLPGTVAAAVGLELGAGEASAQRVAQALADRPLVLVLDTCEHMIDAAAGLAEAVLRAGSAVQVIATSREPLRAEGEWVYPVPPLAVPAAAGDDPWQYAAVQLFVVRARASGARPLRGWEPPPQRLSRRSAGGSTASRWRSSWRRRAPPHSASRRSPPASTIVSSY
jgi:predicted ATPase